MANMVRQYNIIKILLTLTVGLVLDEEPEKPGAVSDGSGRNHSNSSFVALSIVRAQAFGIGQLTHTLTHII